MEQKLFPAGSAGEGSSADADVDFALVVEELANSAVLSIHQSVLISSPSYLRDNAYPFPS